MVNNSLKNRVKNLVTKAKEKGLIKTYDEYCKTASSKNTALSPEEVNYYTSKKKEVTE